MKEQHSPPGPFEVLISNGSNHAIEVSVARCLPPLLLHLTYLAVHGIACAALYKISNPVWVLLAQPWHALGNASTTADDTSCRLHMQHSCKFCCLLQMVTDLLLERGDSILCESFTYFYLVDSVLPIKGYNAIPMEMDNYGICPTKLRQVTLPWT